MQGTTIGGVSSLIACLFRYPNPWPSQLPNDAQLLLAQQIHHSDNVLIVDKAVEDPVSSLSWPLGNFVSDDITERTCLRKGAPKSTGDSTRRYQAIHRRH